MMIVLLLLALISTATAETYVYAPKSMVFARTGHIFTGIDDLCRENPSKKMSPFVSSTVKPVDYDTNAGPSVSETTITTQEDLHNATSMGGHAEASYGPVSGSASANMLTSMELTKNKAYKKFDYSKKQSTRSLSDELQLTEDAKRLLKTDPARFLDMYGKYYISGYEMGCEYSAVISTDFYGSKSSDDNSASGDVKGGGLVAKGEASFEWSSLKQKERSDGNVHVQSSSTGGSFRPVSSVEQLQEAWGRIRDRGVCTASNAAVMRVLVEPYIQCQAVASVLADLGKSDYEKTTSLLEPGLTAQQFRSLNELRTRLGAKTNVATDCQSSSSTCTSPKLWEEDTSKRSEVLDGVFQDLKALQRDLTDLTEATIGATTLADMQTRLRDSSNEMMKALTFPTYTFTFHGHTYYEDYDDGHFTAHLKVDMNGLPQDHVFSELAGDVELMDTDARYWKGTFEARFFLDPDTKRPQLQTRSNWMNHYHNSFVSSWKDATACKDWTKWDADLTDNAQGTKSPCTIGSETVYTEVCVSVTYLWPFVSDEEQSAPDSPCETHYTVSDSDSNGDSPDSCQYANDGECDEPEYCDVGTDTSDCNAQDAYSYTYNDDSSGEYEYYEYTENS